jgi:Flp pilus assembly protein TadD
MRTWSSWGLGKEAIPVIEFTMERYPASRAQGHGLLAEAHILAGNYRAATEIYSRVLEQFPNNAIVRSRLEWLRSR